jgi:hypothetical protein
LYCSGPAVKVVSQALVNTELLFRDFESEPSNRAAVSAPSCQKILTVELEDAEDALNRVLHFAEDRLDYDGHKGLDVELQDSKEQLFFGFEEVIKTAGVGLGTFENLRDSGGGVAAEPKKVEGGFDDAVAGGLATYHSYISIQLKRRNVNKYFVLSLFLALRRGVGNF